LAPRSRAREHAPRRFINGAEQKVAELKEDTGSSRTLLTSLAFKA
jgi:hypothetical protein